MTTTARASRGCASGVQTSAEAVITQSLGNSNGGNMRDLFTYGFAPAEIKQILPRC
jgi:hypothetical protein